MNEREFIKILEERAQEQEQTIKKMFLPKVFIAVSFWLGSHPWRILIPVSIILTIIFHIAFGKRYDELILKIFGRI